MRQSVRSTTHFSRFRILGINLCFFGKVSHILTDLKLMSKRPGFASGDQSSSMSALSEQLDQVELDLTYKTRYSGNEPSEHLRVPEAYERLILDVCRGDKGLFVRSDELAAAWSIFTPLLKQLDARHVTPHKYAYGSRGPIEADALLRRYGFAPTKYHWKKK